MTDGISAPATGWAGHSEPGLLESLWRYRFTSLLLIVAIAAAAAGLGYVTAPKPAATAVVALKDPKGGASAADGGVTSNADFGNITSQKATFATSNAVLAAASGQLGGSYPVSKLERVVSATANKDTDSVEITATAPTTSEAKQVANAVVAAFRSQSAQEVSSTTGTEIDKVNASIADLSGKLSGAKLSPVQFSAYQTAIAQLLREESDIDKTAAVYGDGVHFVTPAKASGTTPTSNATKTGLVGLLFGIVAAAASAWLRADKADRRRYAAATAAPTPRAAAATL